MNTKSLLAGVTVASVLLTGLAVASHVAKVDPASVPVGYLAAHNRISWVGAKAIQRATEEGTDIFVQHIRLGAGEAAPWHNHPGPVLVAVAGGSVTYEKAKDGACFQRLHEAGGGFFDRGSIVHRVVAGDVGAELYATYILPAGSQTHVTPHDAPEQCP